VKKEAGVDTEDQVAGGQDAAAPAKKRRLRQRNVAAKAAFLTKEVLLKKGLVNTRERRAIRWLGILKKLLMDPSLGVGEQDDLFCHATDVDWRNLRRMTGPPPRANQRPRESKKQRNRADWDHDDHAAT
jgi:hypothetical protein